MQKINLPQNSIAQGIVRVFGYRPGTAKMVEPLAAEAMEMKKKIAAAADIQTRRFLQRDYDTILGHIDQILERGLLGLRTEVHNTIVLSDDRGINQIIQQLAGTSSYALEITHGEIGTDGTTPSTSDTALTAPAERKGVTLLTVTAANQVIAQFFWTDAELPNDTYLEFGVYTAGTTLTLGNGRLFNHALLSPAYNKATNEDTRVEVQITINNA